MVERPIKKSERLARAKENGGETSSPEKQGPEKSFRDRESGDRNSDDRDRGDRRERGKGKGKGRGKGKDRDEKPAPVNPALVRGPRPVKIEPPQEEEVVESPAAEEGTDADTPADDSANGDQEQPSE